MTQKEICERFCLDKAHFAMIENALASKKANVLHADKDGLLLTYNGIDMLYGTQNEEAAKRILSVLPHTDMIVCSSQAEVNAIKEVYPQIKTSKPCYQVRYENAVAFPLAGGAVIKPMLPTQENFNLIYSTYTLHYSLAEIEKLVAQKTFLCCELGGEIVGYIGKHEEGSIGLLEVFPSARGKGVGSALLCAAVKSALERGEIAYSNIVENNEASLKLHARLGYYPSKKLIFWCY